MQDIKERLQTAIKKLYGLDFEPDITPSPDNIEADYSSNAPLKLAKELHKSPMAIAEELNKILDANISNPGFLNFTLSDDFLEESINNLVQDFAKTISSNTFSCALVNLNGSSFITSDIFTSLLNAIPFSSLVYLSITITPLSHPL